MKYRFKHMFLLFFLILTCALLTGCVEESSGIEAEGLGDSVLAMDGSEQVQILEFEKEEELLGFLNVFDESRYAIIDISINDYYNPDKFSVTFLKYEEPRIVSEDTNEKEFHIFTSEDINEYKNFIANFDYENNEIHTVVKVNDYRYKYVVIYRE